MHVRLLVVTSLAAALALPATVHAAPRTAIFFYPWYSTPHRDGGYAHWQQGGHAPPFDVASQFFPVRGAYSSSDPRILHAQMRDIAAAGVDEVVSSWWGWGSVEDERLPAVIRAARAADIKAAVQIEPYIGRTPATIAADVAHLRELGIRDVYVYSADDFAAWRWLQVTMQPSAVRFFAQTSHVGFAAKAGFDGFYTYDILLYGGDKFARFCAQAHEDGILCGPSVGPGYAAARGTGDLRVKPRLGGATYDIMWRAALDARADLVTITSYNEWGEGTQIEPARSGGHYESYDGAYGLFGDASQRAYIARTRYWTSRFSP